MRFYDEEEHRAYEGNKPNGNMLESVIALIEAMPSILTLVEKKSSKKPQRPLAIPSYFL